MVELLDITWVKEGSGGQSVFQQFCFIAYILKDKFCSEL